MRVKDKVAVVSGGARGMGASHARLLAEEGASVVLVDVLDDLGQETAEELVADGLKAHYISLDVTDEAGWEAAIAEVEESIGAPTILVNNAGVGGTVGGVEVEDASTWNETVAINQTGTFLGMRALAGDGIRVNSICPGIIRTPMDEMEPEIDVYIDATPMKRLGEPEEVSYAVLFLASDEASFVTGADLLVDGGYVAQ